MCLKYVTSKHKEAEISSLHAIHFPAAYQAVQHVLYSAQALQTLHAIQNLLLARRGAHG